MICGFSLSLKSLLVIVLSKQSLTMKLNIILYLAIIVCISFSCSNGKKDDAAFDDKIVILENHPQVILAQLDTCRIVRISNEHDATVFLLQTLARSYTQKGFRPDKHKLQDCLSVFEQKDKIQQQLETLYLLAGIYGQEQNVRKEIETVEHAMVLARQVDDQVWMFHLYSYLSEMYFKQFNMLEFIRYQAMALQSISNENIEELDANTLLLLSKSYLHTGQEEKAGHLLSELSAKVKPQHIGYPEIHRTWGQVLFSQGRFEMAADEFEKALSQEKDSCGLLACYSMLSLCHYHLNNQAQAEFYKEEAGKYESEKTNSYGEIEFYKGCAEFAARADNHEEEVRCMQRVIDKYDQIVTNLSGNTLDEAIQKYVQIQERQKHDRQIHIYQRVLLVALLCLVFLILYNQYRKKKQFYQLLTLQRRIETLEQLEKMQDETRQFILRDLEIAKKIAMLKYTRKEKSERLLRELDNLNIIEGNKLMATRWDDFYHDIDITFDGFHDKLVHEYPDLNEKEVQLCCLMMAGFRTEEIAAVWMQSVFTVHKCKTNVRKKINTSEGGDIIVFLKKKFYGQTQTDVSPSISASKSQP